MPSITSLTSSTERANFVGSWATSFLIAPQPRNPDADQNWTKVDEVHDVGGWTTRDANINDCPLSPFAYAAGQIITWAGSYVTFRMDNGSCNFKRFSEVAPLPRGPGEIL
jgi:hypothetical protein